jgi:hypothetical protein
LQREDRRDLVFDVDTITDRLVILLIFRKLAAFH